MERHERARERGLSAAFLTEGGGKAGLGHISRCSSLASALSDLGVGCRFFVLGPEDALTLSPGLDAVRCDWRLMGSGSREELSRCDLIVVDSYSIDSETMTILGSLPGSKVFIDDLLRSDYPPGLVVNPALGVTGEAYGRESSSVPRLLGARYALLRKEITNGWRARPVSSKVRRVLVTTGGQDAMGLTPRILRILAESRPTIEKTVVIGPGFRNTDEIESLRDQRTELLICPNAEKMKEAMLSADLAISAAGQTLYELACLGVPTIALSVAKNQEVALEAFGRAGFSLTISSVDESSLGGALEDCLGRLEAPDERVARAARGRELLDGHGANRVARECVDWHVERQLSIRPAREDDIEAVLELSNQEDVRSASFREGPIGSEEHRAWFGDTLRDASTLFLVAEVGQHIAGQLRVKISDGVGELSISTHRSFRGAGIGRALLEEAASRLSEKFPEVQLLEAWIRRDNPASIGFFERLGFVRLRHLEIRDRGAVVYGRAPLLVKE